MTRAESLGVDDELTGPGMEGFLSTIDDVLAAGPDGLYRRGDVTGVELWLIPDGEILDYGAVITVDLANRVRLSTLHQDIKDFARRDQRGIPAVLSALQHIANQVCLLLETYQKANPTYLAGAEAVAMTDNTATPATQPGTATFTERQVHKALAQAANNILDAVNAGDEGLPDAINLMVNAALSYLVGEAEDLPGVVDANYSDDYETVIGWVEEAA
jgi:hypothetical protein